MYYDKVLLMMPRARKMIKSLGPVNATIGALHTGDYAFVSAVVVELTRDTNFSGFKDFLKSDLMSKLNLLFFSTNDYGLVTLLSVKHWILWKYERGGRRVYRVTDGMSQRFTLTDLRGVRFGDVRLPYPCVHVNIPSCLGARCGEDTIDSVFLTEIDTGVGRNLAVLLSASVGDKTRPIYVSIPMPEDRFIDYEYDFDGVDISDERDERDVAEMWHPLFRWLLNFLFYSTHPGSELRVEEMNEFRKRLLKKMASAKTDKIRKKLGSRLDFEPENRVIIVGRSFHVDNDMPVTLGDAVKSLTTRTLVAGHWQRYAVGKGRVERIWKFREPYWRGAGEEGPRVHEVR